MSHRLARLAHHLYRTQSTAIPFLCARAAAAAGATTRTQGTRFISSTSRRSKTMSDEVDAARAAAAKKMEEEADAGVVRLG